MIRRLFMFLFLSYPCFCWGDNVVFNPGFDMSPWDTGWTIETDTSSEGDVTLVIAEVKPDSGKSLPNCCYLRTYSQIEAGGGGGTGKAEAKAMITQNFDGITDCKIKAYLKWRWDSACWLMYAMMEGCINNEWKVIWEIDVPTGVNRETTWTEVGTTLVNDTLSGIRFCTESSFYTTCHCGFGWCRSYLWVDDISIEKLGIEEEEIRVKNIELKVYPNPFTTGVRVQGSGISKGQEVALKVYDMMGRLVEETKKSIIGEELPPGVYFVKIKGYNPVKIIKLKSLRGSKV